MYRVTNVATDRRMVPETENMSRSDLKFESGSHICQIYETFAQQKEVVLPFISEGLRSGECCLLIANDPALDEWRLELQEYGVDVQREERRGALNLATGVQLRGEGPLNSLLIARGFLAVIHDLCADFRGVRMIGDVEWELNPAFSSDQLCHLEATANLVVEGERIQAICQLSRKNYSDSAIYAALRTHPIVIHEGRTYRNNPNYEAPRILENEPYLNHSEADALVIENALARLSP
jgi:hypothetical protein